MSRKLFQQGEILFEEGDQSDYACRILSGEAEVIKRHHGEEVVLGAAKAGEFIGEMGVLQDMPRSATVRAADSLVVELYPKDAFLRQVSADGRLALQLLVRLSERLKATDQAFAEVMAAISRGDAVPGPGVPPLAADAAVEPGALPPLRLYADDAEIEDSVPNDGIAIRSLPFVVGRHGEKGEPVPPVAVDLALDDAPPYRLSRAHFSIIVADDGYCVRDLGSMLGTDVNGRFLGGLFDTDDAPLVDGDNVVVAGGLGSPFKFRVAVGPALARAATAT